MEEELERLVATLQAEQCIVLLGPDIACTETGESYHQALVETLKPETSKHILKYYEEDEFFLFQPPNGKLNSFIDIKGFYKKNKHSETLLRKIAQLPVPLIISLNPDQTMFQVLKRNGIAADFAFYNKKKAAGDITPPTVDKPLVYNIFGSIDSMDSLILTHQDLFDFLVATLKTNPLPDNLMDSISNSLSFLFIGFRFDKWYVQLLLRLLKLENNKYSNTPSDKKNKAFYSEQFNFVFTDFDVEQFIDLLIGECSKSDVSLRQLGEAISDVELKIKLSIERNRIAEACDLLKQLKPESETEIIMLLAKYNGLEDQQKNKIIDYKEYNLELNKVKFGLLSLLA